MPKDLGIIFLEEPRIGEPLEMMYLGKKMTSDPVKKIIRNDEDGTIKIVTTSGFSCVGKVEESVVASAGEEIEIVEEIRETEEIIEIIEPDIQTVEIVSEPDAEVIIPETLFSNTAEPAKIIWSEEDASALENIFNQKEEDIIVSQDESEIIFASDDEVEAVPQAEQKPQKVEDEDIEELLKVARSKRDEDEDEDLSEKFKAKPKEEVDSEEDYYVQTTPSTDPDIIPEEYEEDSFFKEPEKPWLHKKRSVNKKALKRAVLTILKVASVLVIVALLAFTARTPILNMLDNNRTKQAYKDYIAVLEENHAEIMEVVSHMEVDRKDHMVTLVISLDDWMNTDTPSRHELLTNAQAEWRSALEKNKIEGNEGKLEIVNEKRVKMAHAFPFGATIFKNEEVIEQTSKK